MGLKTILLLTMAGTAGGYLATMATLSLLSRRRPPLGIRDGRLLPCPPTPNCVCSQCDDPAHRLEPFPFTGPAADALERLKTVLAAHPRTRLVTVTPSYVHAECVSAVFRFVDDVEFLLDPQQAVIHCRSASRVGRFDLGTNRRRLLALRRAFMAGPGTAWAKPSGGNGV